MQHIWRKFTRLITAPFRFIRRLFRGIYRGFSNLSTNLHNFFTEEPEDTPLPDTLAKTVTDPTGLFVHVDALRKHLLRAVAAFFITTIIAVTFNEYILEFMTRPVGGIEDVIAIDVTEPLATVMKTSLLVGFALALPYIAFELYLFIAPAISPRARVWGLLSIPAVLVLFVTGMAFAYFVMLPTAVPFLLNIGGVTAQIRLSSIVSFVTRVLFWIGLSFEFPLVIFILASLGIVNARMLAVNWRIAIVLIAVIAALVTPTIDPVNMVIVMGPLILLYFLSIGLASLAQRRRGQEPIEQKEEAV
jgi:sec-independent protein translocase protein TatC